MKKKLFLLLCALLTTVGTWAYTTDDLITAGWTKETSSLTDVNNKYFILVDAGAGYTSGMSVKHNANTNNSLYYQALGHPLSKNQMWKLSVNDGKYTIQALNDDCYVNGNGDGWNRTVDASESTGKFTITLNSGVWHIVSTGSYSPGSTFGPWDGTKTDGTDMHVAINKKNDATAVGEGVNAPGFYLYSLPRPQDVTSTYITNPSFEADATNTGTPTGWSISGTAGTKKVVDADSEIGDGYGKVTTLTDGSKGYGIRQAWAEATFSIYQSVTLPAAFYVLKVDEKSVYAAEGSSKTPSFKLYAGGTQSENFAFTTQLANSNSFFPSYDFSTKSLSFYSDGSEVNIGVSISFMNKRNDVLLDNFKLYSYPAATSSDYAALKDALDAVEGNILGFEVGEYAPYTNKDAFVSLAVAKAINPSADNTQREVQTATTLLNAATWTANIEKMNAFSWNSADYIDNADSQTPFGFTNGDGGDIRVSANYGSNTGLNQLDPKMCLNINTNDKAAIYGETDGYTLPLKANTVYELAFRYAGWGNSSGSPTITILKEDDSELKSVTLNPSSVQGNSTTEPWTLATIRFLTTDAGNYKVSFSKSGNRTAFGNLELAAVAASATMQVSGVAKMGTFCAPFDVEIPSGVKAYTLSESSNASWVHMNEVSGTTIDAGTPVLLTSDEKVEKDFEANMAVLEPDNDGLLKGVFVKTPVAKDANNYLLQYQDSKCAFYLVSDDGINIGKNRCYLNVDANNSARIAIGGEDGPTAINEIEVIESEAKTMKDGKYLVKGRIVLVKNGKAFSANGQKLN